MSQSDDHTHDSDLATQNRTEIQEPSFYKVMLLNDDFTPMDFVVELLMRHFRKSHEDAMRIMLEVHHDGRGLCGVFPRDLAETKVSQVNQYARDNDHPLKCAMEPN
ncbi:MAG: ATP-dependent Clp protease adapter ClpS [Magnetococcales bacterium]|nr:ATP-dependent Clp protease adapter ClpS [Magnetococcales bacterium]